MVLSNGKISSLILYLTEYFFVIFIVLIVLDVLRLVPTVVNSAALRYSIIGVIMFALFLIFNIFGSVRNEYKASPITTLVSSLMSVTLIVPIIQILRNKRMSTKRLTAEGTFMLGVGYFFIIFIVSLLFFEIIYHVPHLLGIIVGTGQITNPNTSLSQYSSLIIIHNFVFMVEIVLGAFFFLVPTFGAILLDSLITTPILLYLITSGHYNSVLPQLLLEIIGTSLATGSAFLIFDTFFTSMTTKNRTYDSIRIMNYSKKIILFGIILSAYAFLLGWPVESELISLNINSELWYHSVYLFDVITAVIYAAFLYDILARKVFPLQKLILPSLWAGIFLFITLAGGGKYAGNLFLELFLLSFISLIYPTLWLARSRIKHKSQKWFTNLLVGTSCVINKASGRSMYPALSSKDYIISYFTDDKFQFKIGDIISYEPLLAYSPLVDSRYVAHRVIEIRDDKIVTKGDNLKKADPPFKPFKIQGLVIASYDPELGLYSSLTERKDMDGVVDAVKQIITDSNIFTSGVSRDTKKLLFHTILLPLTVSVILPILFLFVL